LSKDGAAAICLACLVGFLCSFLGGVAGRFLCFVLVIENGVGVYCFCDSEEKRLGPVTEGKGAECCFCSCEENFRVRFKDGAAAKRSAEFLTGLVRSFSDGAVVKSSCGCCNVRRQLYAPESLERISLFRSKYMNISLKGLSSEIEFAGCGINR
jgi:hypothetical protein